MSSLVTSIEFLEHTLSSSTTLSSGTLNKGQDITNCVPFVSHYCSSDYPDAQFFDVWFEDNGTPSIHFQRDNTAATTSYIKVYIVEFDPEKVKVYQGELPTVIGDSPETTTTVSGGLFDTNHSALKFYHRSDSTSNRINHHLCRGYLTTSSGSYGTDISFKRRLGNTTNIYGHYYIFESITDDFTVQHITGDLTTEDANFVDNLDWHNTFLLTSYCGSDDAEGDVYRTTIRSYIWGNTCIKLNKSDSSSVAYYNTQAITFDNDATISGTRYCPKITNYHNLSTSQTERNLSINAEAVSNDTKRVLSHQSV